MKQFFFQDDSNILDDVEFIWIWQTRHAGKTRVLENPKMKKTAKLSWWHLSTVLFVTYFMIGRERQRDGEENKQTNHESKAVKEK